MPAELFSCEILGDVPQRSKILIPPPSEARMRHPPGRGPLRRTRPNLLKNSEHFVYMTHSLHVSPYTYLYSFLFLFMFFGLFCHMRYWFNMSVVTRRNLAVSDIYISASSAKMYLIPYTYCSVGICLIGRADL